MRCAITKSCFAVFIALSLFCVMSPHARAADPYVVAGVQADVTAETAPKARDQAIREAHRKAFEALSKQLFPKKPVPKISDKTLGNMVSDFRVEQEQATATRYVATFTFRFRQSQVRAAFGNRDIISPTQLAERLKNPPVDDGADTVADAAAGDDSLDAIIQTESVPEQTRMGAKKPGLRMDTTTLPSPGNSILVEVTANNSHELEQSLGRFQDVTAVREVAYVSVTPDKSILRLSYAGAQSALLKDMAAKGVVLSPAADTNPPLFTLAP